MRHPPGPFNDFVFNVACSPCLRPTEVSKRCASGARDDLTYMCITCQARSLYFGPYCESCGVNHTGECG